MKPWVRELEWPDHYVDYNGHLHLLAVDSYYTMSQLLNDAWRESSTFDVRFYRLVDADIPLATINPRNIRVQGLTLDEGDSHAVPRRRERRRERGVPRGPRGLADLMSELHDIGPPPEGPGDEEGEPSDAKSDESDEHDDPDEPKEDESSDHGIGDGWHIEEDKNDADPSEHVAESESSHEPEHDDDGTRDSKADSSESDALGGTNINPCMCNTENVSLGVKRALRKLILQTNALVVVMCPHTCVWLEFVLGPDTRDRSKSFANPAL